ncbi:hypothetical protein TNCV_1866801 [Trichonephila clavipes]|nr:hypothetical protein TNCV_1866801 [Trichonephila clavipes]
MSSESSTTKDPPCRGAMNVKSVESSNVLSEGVNINVALFSYTKGFGDEPRNFEQWSSDVDETRVGTPSANYHTTPTAGPFSSRQI